MTTAKRIRLNERQVALIARALAERGVRSVVATIWMLGNAVTTLPIIFRKLAVGRSRNDDADDDARQRELADAVIGSGEGWIAELSDAELAELVSLRAAP